MMCPDCKSAADLMEAAEAVFPDPLDDETGPLALAVAAAIVKLHARCGDRCPCQHRGTPVARRPVTTPVALITSPLVGTR